MQKRKDEENNLKKEIRSSIYFEDKAQITIQQEELWLMKERAVYLPQYATLIIADLHLGKAATFRHFGIALPEGSMAGDLERLSRILQKTGANRLIVLGDLIHSAHGKNKEVFELFLKWRSSHQRLSIMLIEGNHDRFAGGLPQDWRIDRLPSPTVWGNFELTHDKKDSQQINEGKVQLSGHLHPGIMLTGGGKDRLRMACFWQRQNHLMLPAFSSFTGLAKIDIQQKDQVWGVMEKGILSIVNKE